jgi:RNA polymerase sigma factor (sigma-70 family)
MKKNVNITTTQSGEKMKHQKTIDNIIYPYLKYNMDYEELKSVAYLGYSKALNKYDLKFGMSFKNYMAICVKGEIKDYCRKNDPLTRSQRKIYTKIRKLQEEKNYTSLELAKKLNVSINRIIEILNIIQYKRVNLDDLHNVLTGEYENKSEYYKLLLKEIKKAILPREEFIINCLLMDYDDCEIAKKLKISNSSFFNYKQKLFKKIRCNFEKSIMYC